MRLLFPGFLFLLLAQCVFAQSASDFSEINNRVSGQIMVQLTPEARVERIVQAIVGKTPQMADVRLSRTLAPDWHIHLLAFNEEHINGDIIKSLLQSLPGVQKVQFNHRTEERSNTPNDVDWVRQSDMDFIGTPQAWDFSTGGLMSSRNLPNPDTIVVAVLEKGALMTHPDLAPNRWHNIGEIPNNSVDDDGNGFVDDYAGWNPRYQNDSLGTRGTHGTSVNGIIGAKGDNSIGVAGINWNIKLMNLSDISLEDEIVEGYYYAGNMRKRYNQSNGAKGAFVVATNASFGINNAMAADFPLWCAIYDSLGRVGIINVAATANADRDVDKDGDMPTTCTSEFMVAVTNTDVFGNKVVSAGYGQHSVDLGAPGDGTFTTESTPDFKPAYGDFGGTSAACPHVTGSVALLYSMGCPAFTNDALSDPVACGRRVRDIILESVKTDESLADRSTTGGYLSLENAVKSIFDLCEGTVGPLQIIEVRDFPNEDRMLVYYQTPNFTDYSFRVFSALGQLMYETSLKPKEFQENYIEFSTHLFPAGVYTMTLAKGKARVSRKFVKV